MRARAHTHKQTHTHTHTNRHTHTHQLNLGSSRSGLSGVTPDNWPCSDTGIQIAGVHHVQKTDMIINLVTGNMATAASKLNKRTLSYYETSL